MRLFVAVEVTPEVQQNVSRLIQELQRRMEESAPRARITWVAPACLHFTVCFIGQVEPTVAQRVHAALDTPLESRAFELTLGGLGTFPPRRLPRVIWAGIMEGADSMRTIEHEVRTRLSFVALEDAREYSPHLTLGRVKNPAGLKSGVLLEGLDSGRLGVVAVEAVTLFESRLSSKEPTYIPIVRTPLARTAWTPPSPSSSPTS